MTMGGEVTGLPQQDLVLVGAGYAHLHLVRQWRMAPIPGVRLTVVSPDRELTYSGMLPGVLAGLYSADAATIDLPQLCLASSARLISAAVTGMDPDSRIIRVEGRPPIPFDVASIAIGSSPCLPPAVAGVSEVISIKPLGDFESRFSAAVSAVRSRMAVATHDRPVAILVVGGGAAGCELALALERWMVRRQFPARFLLVESQNTILRGYSSRTVERMQRELRARGVALRVSQSIVGVDRREPDSSAGEFLLKVQFEDGSVQGTDLVIWATGGGPMPLVEHLGLPRDDRGFLLVQKSLQSISGAPVFAAGDVASLLGCPLPRAGVHAVRQGAMLWNNIQHWFQRQPLREYRPRGFLSLLSLGNGRALADLAGWSFEGSWVWKWKDAIDRRFLQMNRIAPSPLEEPGPGATGEGGRVSSGMRCSGCGSKVSASVLKTALGRLEGTTAGGIQGSRRSPDDAVVVDREKFPVDVFSVDFFPAFLDDPYLMGRIAALHALSDLWAMGARPVGGQALVTLPPGTERQQSELLYQLLAGGLHELKSAGAELWGGHTTEGGELLVGFSVAGCLDGTAPLLKSGLVPGQSLILTKPLGVGAVVAAIGQGQVSAGTLAEALHWMLRSNASAARAARQSGVTSVTDVTGFGLAGHLLEMLESSQVSARLQLQNVPRIGGCRELFERGIRSSLDAANRKRAEGRIEVTAGLAESDVALLFDPQTSGGLLLGVPGDQAQQIVTLLRQKGDDGACVVGVIESPGSGPGGWRIRVE